MDTSVTRSFSASSNAHGVLEWKIENARSLRQQTKYLESECLSVSDYGHHASSLQWNLLLKPDTNLDKRDGGPRFVGLFLELRSDEKDGETKIPTTFSLQAFLPKTGSWKSVCGSAKKEFVANKEDGWGRHDAISHMELFRQDSPYISDDDVLLVRGVFDFETESNPVLLPAASTQRMADLYTSKEFSDYELISSDGVKFPDHRSILAAHSTVFRAMFMKKTRRSVVAGVDGATLDILLKFVYAGETAKVKGSAEKVLEAASRYNVADLRELAVKHLRESLSVDNAYRLSVMAHRRNLPDLRDAVSEFIVKNWDALRQTPAYMQLKKDNGPVYDVLEKACATKKRKSEAV